VQQIPVFDADKPREFAIDDPYARLDQLAELGLTIEPGLHVATSPVDVERQILEQVNDLRDEVGSDALPDFDEQPPAGDSWPIVDAAVDPEDGIVWDVIEPESDESVAVEHHAAMHVTTAAACVEGPPTLVVENADNPLHAAGEAPLSPRAMGGSPPEPDRRRFAQLFTRLQRRRRAMAETLRATIPYADR
jgi:hypothetical protein